MNKTLLNVFKQLNEAHLLYAIGGSMMLKLRSFDVIPQDCDIMVMETDFQSVVEIFQCVATQVNKPSLLPYKTKHFTTFNLEDITIDIMAGFTYEHLEGTYYTMFDSESITDWVQVEEIKLPLMSLEEWFILYNIMNRLEKTKLIETYWKLNVIKHPQLLSRQLHQNIPSKLVLRITNILNNCK